MRDSCYILVDERQFLHLLEQVRKAQGKLYQVKGGRELIDEIDWIIKGIELTTYTQAEETLEDFKIQEGLTDLE